MKKRDDVVREPLFDGVHRSLRAIDSQIAREMQRTPTQSEMHGVTKWAPMSKRVELLSAFFLDHLGDAAESADAFSFESLLVMAQSTVKALSLIVRDLGEADLGEIRSSYARDALSTMQFDVERALVEVSQTGKDLTQ
jgi:hypothetical protein